MVAWSRRTRLASLGLCGWTLLTWVTRVPLLWGDEDVDAATKGASSVPVVVFVALASVAGVATLRRSGRAGAAVAVLAGWSLAYWAVRLPLVLVNDHPLAFDVVHSVLALVSCSLSALALAGLAAAGGRPRLRPRPSTWGSAASTGQVAITAPGDGEPAGRGRGRGSSTGSPRPPSGTR